MIGGVFAAILTAAAVSGSYNPGSTFGEVDAFISCPADAECLKCVRIPGCTYLEALPKFSLRPSLCLGTDLPMPFPYFFTAEYKTREQCFSGLGDTPSRMAENPILREMVFPLSMDMDSNDTLADLGTTSWGAFQDLGDGVWQSVTQILAGALLGFAASAVAVLIWKSRKPREISTGPTPTPTSDPPSSQASDPPSYTSIEG